MKVSKGEQKIQTSSSSWPTRFGPFLVGCPVFWSCRLAVLCVERDCCRRLERFDTGEDVGREKKRKKFFFEIFCDFSKKFLAIRKKM